MKTLFTTAGMVMILAFATSSLFAQSDYYKFEVFGGYSYMNLNRGIDPDEFNDDFTDTPANRVNAHGFNGSATYNFSRYVGAKFDLTLHTHGEDFTAGLYVNPPTNPPTFTNGTFKTSQSLYQYLGGIQIKDNAKDGAKLKPWAHALVGIGTQSFSIDQTAPVNTQLFKVDSTDLAMKFGGGVDYKVHKNIDIRLIGVDWNPIWRGDMQSGTRFGELGGVLQNNWLLNFGVVVH